MTTGPVLDVADLSVAYTSGTHEVSAVSHVSLTVRPGEIVGVVGESGCGKSTLALAVLGVLDRTARVSGRVAIEGKDLATLDAEGRRRLRGDRISMVPQDPLTSLDPAFAVGEQVAETIRAHRPVSAGEARDRAIGLLAAVGIPAAAERYRDAPHRLSGGMRQRVVIATALANDPALLVADEPSTALDVTIQAQLLALLRDLRDQRGMAILLIAHDLGVIAQLCDRVAIMYAGQLVEDAPVGRIFRGPLHPYTQALLAAQPGTGTARGQLRVIGGQVPDLADPPPGCRFAPRCPLRMPVCDTTPTLRAAEPDHHVACWADPTTHPGVAA
jgi:peptide/nickel transport system ATP-binding protein